MKEIEGFEGLYSATEDGRVFSHRKDRFLNPTWYKGCYLVVRLFSQDLTIRKSIHRIIAEAFIPNPENKPQVNHKNGLRNDNRVENLEWCTKSENIRHSFRELSRKIARGANHPQSRLVIDLNTGIFYDCTTEAAFSKGLMKTRLKSGLRKGVYHGLVYA